MEKEKHKIWHGVITELCEFLPKCRVYETGKAGTNSGITKCDGIVKGLVCYIKMFNVGNHLSRVLIYFFPKWKKVCSQSF